MAEDLKPRPYTLKLALDINQVTRSLQYEFTSPKGSPRVKTGPLAGTDCFNQSDTLGFEVTATGKASDDISIEIVQFCLVSQGTGLLGRYGLSLFDEERAVNQISNWEAPTKELTKEDISENRTRLISKSSDILTVISKTGSWKISGHLSVKIILNGDTYYRDFHFDPEGSSGHGGGLGFP